MSDDDILNTGINSFKNVADSISNGVLRNVSLIFHSTLLVQQTLFQNLAYFWNSLY